MQVDSVETPFRETNATCLMNLVRANDGSSPSRVVQVDSFKTRVVSAHGFSALNYDIMNCFQTLLSNST